MKSFIIMQTQKSSKFADDSVEVSTQVVFGGGAI